MTAPPPRDVFRAIHDMNRAFLADGPAAALETPAEAEPDYSDKAWAGRVEQAMRLSGFDLNGYLPGFERLPFNPGEIWRWRCQGCSHVTTTPGIHAQTCQTPPSRSAIAAGTKDTNPKDAIAGDKLPLGLFPATAMAAGAMALHDGALKYGRSNWRAAGVRASVYHTSTLRHLMAWFEGQDNDPDSGLPHLAHALAGLAILVDAGAAGKLTDDRPIAGGYADFAASLAPSVAKLREQHAGRNPRHYTRADGPPRPAPRPLPDSLPS